MHSIVCGRKPVIEALRAGRTPERILILRGVRGPIINELRLLAEQRGVPVLEADQHELEEFAPGTTTQGVLALIPTRQLTDLASILEQIRTSGETGFLLILDQIEDPQNFGALIRTAECAGVHGVLFPRHHAAPVTASVVKASAGATEHMPLAEVTNIVATVEELKKEGFWVVGMDSGGDRLFTDLDYSVPVALVVGNEGKGIRRLVKEHCDHLVRIPLFGKVPSLNASVAGALVMYEVVRNRERR